MNDHFAAISTDHHYRAPDSKHIARDNFITEMAVFQILDTLQPTATGLDSVPAWFLRLGAPVFAALVDQLFNQSTSNDVVPHQWKTTVITPHLKGSKPTQPVDSRPISFSHVLLKGASLEGTCIQPYNNRHLNPTTSAIVAVLHTVRTMLLTNQYVRVFSFDFTKAFDMVTHMTLIRKLATLTIPDNIYNWINDFFGEHYHCTRFDGQCCPVVEVKASIIQGSAPGPASYVVTAADLHPVTPANRIFNTSNARDELTRTPFATSRRDVRDNS